MTQIAKRWLRKKKDTFTIEKYEGGIAGSLVGLEYIERDRNLYRITEKGKKWLEGGKRVKRKIRLSALR